MDRFADRTRNNRPRFGVGLIATLLFVASSVPSAAQVPDPCAPLLFVTVSDGPTITSNDIAEFDAV
jgi:hypothetical protein